MTDNFTLILLQIEKEEEEQAVVVILTGGGFEMSTKVEFSAGYTFRGSLFLETDIEIFQALPVLASCLHFGK